MAISQFFGWHVQERLQKIIQNKHHGELLIGTAEIVETKEDIIEEKQIFPQSWWEAAQRHQLLYSDNVRDFQH